MLLCVTSVTAASSAQPGRQGFRRHGRIPRPDAAGARTEVVPRGTIRVATPSAPHPGMAGNWADATRVLASMPSAGLPCRKRRR